MRKNSDIKLAENFRNGDHQAFQKVFHQFYRPLVFFAEKLIRNRSEAEDIVVVTMSKLWGIHRNFDTILNVQAFLYITVRNQCLNYLKKQQTDSRNATLFEHLLSSNEDFVLSQMVHQEILEEIKTAIDTLSAQRKQVLLLIFYENMSQQEIAEKMNLSLNTVRNTKAQALEQLRKVLFKKRMLVFLVLLVLSAASN